MELDRPAGTRTEIEALDRRDAKITDLLKETAGLRDSFRAEFLRSGASKLPAAVIQAFQMDPAKRNAGQKELVAKYTGQLDQELAAAMSAETRRQIAAREDEIRRLREATPDLPRGYFLHEPSATTPVTHLLHRGQPTRPGPEVGPGMPAVLVEQQPAFPAANASTSLRRLTLARWIARPDHPLTARVIVNRVWKYLFGEGLVRLSRRAGPSRSCTA
jgi:hypothetical protein